MSSWRDWLTGYDAHHRLAFSGLAGALSAAATLALKASWSLVLLAGWDGFALAMLLLAWLRIFLEDARTSVREAKLQDSSRTVIFLVLVVAAAAALVGVALLLGTSKGAAPEERACHILLAGGTIVLTWALIHTVFALHYVHLFYQRAHEHHPELGDGKGLEFPGEPHPGFLDFAYFSFVIGMTCQVSDVQITARRLRRLALGHGLLSFAYNTVILALTINLASSVVFSG